MQLNQKVRRSCDVAFDSKALKVLIYELLSKLKK